VVDSAAGLTAVYMLAVVAFGSFYTPGMALGSARAARVGLSQGLAFGTMNSAWALGQVVGASGGGRLAEVGGDTTAWIAAAVVCGVTLLATERVRTRSPVDQPV